MNKIFEGIKVLDFTSNMAGPLATSMLSDFGAEVIKVERPIVGDDTRAFWPQLDGIGVSSLFYNRGKKSITIDLTDSEGIEIIKEMILDMDVFIESNKPGVMKKFGLDYESVSKIKPDIIYCSVSAFGQTGLYADKPGYDLIAQALSGLMAITGEADGPPMKSGAVIADYVGSLNTYGAISSALYHRLKTGEGQHIDISLLDCLLPSHNYMEISQVLGKPSPRGGNHHLSALCPYGLFNGNNKESMVICAPNNKLWTEICRIMGMPHYATDPEFSTSAGRFKNIKKVIDIIEDWIKTFDDINKPIKLLDDAGIPCCRVLNPIELANDENLKSRGLLIDLVTPNENKDENKPKIKTKGVWIKMSKTPGTPGVTQNLGQSNFEILQRYNVSKEKIEQLQKRWSDKVQKNNK